MSGRPVFLPQTEGWYLEPELSFLYQTAMSLDPAKGPVLEVGCYRGLSTSALARAGLVVVVDNFQGCGDSLSPVMTRLSETGDALKAKFWENMRSLGLEGNICLIVGDSTKVLPTLQDPLRVYKDSVLTREIRIPFRLVHLDSDHKSPGVDAEMRECWRLLAPGGALVVDDVDWPDVGRATESLPVPLRRFDKKVGFAMKPA